MKCITIKGAKQNNLKSVNVEIPLGALTVVCGPSGSGKSSLAFETLFAEGQRYYTETLSNYARQYVQECPKPLVDRIINIPPTLALEQNNSVRSSRPTVATLTEVADCLRLLFTCLAYPSCPVHKEPLLSFSPEEGARKIRKVFKNQKGLLLMPVSVHSAIHRKGLRAQLMKDGFYRVGYFDKRKKNAFPVIQDLRTTKSLLSKKDIYLVLDRLIFTDVRRLTDSIRLAYTTFFKYNPDRTSAELRVVSTEGGCLYIGQNPLCPLCSYEFPLPIQSSLFSFNSSLGACPECKGFGNYMALDESKIVPEPGKSISQGAIAPLSTPSAVFESRSLKQFCRSHSIDLHCPWKKLPAHHKKMIWKGSRNFKGAPSSADYWGSVKNFIGIQNFFNYLETRKYKMHVRVFLARYKSPETCQKCFGLRFRPEISNIFFRDKTLPELLNMDIKTLTQFFRNVKWTKMEIKKAGEVIRKLLFILNGLNDIGLHYLSLNRQVRTLSSGEFQRLNLVHQLGLGLSQVLYVLDEPTVGLHPKDTLRLIYLLQKLNKQGNTLVIVEHDPEVIKTASFIIELGPGSGIKGGEVVFSGSKEQFLKNSSSQTSSSLQWKNIRKKLFSSQSVDRKNYRYFLEITGCKAHNLKNVHLKLPLNRLVTVTGVSGSGKSTLVSQTLYPALARALGKKVIKGHDYLQLKGTQYLKQVVLVDQSPVEKTKKSLPVTYLKFYDQIRSLMAKYGQNTGGSYFDEIKPGYFSLNVEGGRCPECKGWGYQEIEMVFMDPVRTPCNACKGKRFTPEILDIKWKGKNIHQILSMTVESALAFFVSYPAIWKPLSFLKKVGLEYLVLGQSLSTLSGGESQRLKLARELLQKNPSASLYILDEPSVGLHFREVRMLLQVLHQLVKNGNTVVMIEHNMELIRHSDYLIDMGPGAGEEGGEIAIEGSPLQLASQSKGSIGPFLKQFLRA